MTYNLVTMLGVVTHWNAALRLTGPQSGHPVRSHAERGNEAGQNRPFS
jgi:hypothetical protein